MFSNKRVFAKVSNPKILEEKVLFMSSKFLQFDMSISGDISSLVQRKDQEFNDIQEYLSLKYPNVIVPPVEKPKELKRDTDTYMRNRS